MLMVQVGRMGVSVPLGPVMVRVAVHHTVQNLLTGLMRMVVMAIIMAVRMFMMKGFMLMLVFMSLRQVHQDTHEHQRAAQRHPQAEAAVTQHHGRDGADEWCERIDGPSPPGADPPLRQ
jgi:hypothetical protein